MGENHREGDASALSTGSVEDLLNGLYQVLLKRKTADPSHSYVARLYQRGTDRILQKVGEEAVEVILAAKGVDRQVLIEETTDLWFHTLVMLAEREISPMAIMDELRRRAECLPTLSRLEAISEQRRNERRGYQKTLTLQMQSGEIIEGVTRNVSMEGICLATAYHPKWHLLGEEGTFELEVNQRIRTFTFKVVRVTDDMLGLHISQDVGLFGFALSDELFQDLF
jgi:phosphoribosyl-ATP pyrophosphohydrolase